MITKQFLYQSTPHLIEQLSYIDAEKPCLVQIFTNGLRGTQALALAQTVQGILPLAQVIGSSVSGVIYQGEQYENRTLVVAEQYRNVAIETNLISLSDKRYQDIAAQVTAKIGESDGTPALMRMFVGAYYDYAHQLIGALNTRCPALKIVGGMAGELQPFPKDIPFVFDAQQVLEEGLVFCALKSASLMVYGRINTAHETIGDVYTITEAKGSAILAIEGEPAQEWLQRNFGVLSTKAFDSWEDIAQNDPLVRLQLALEEHKRAIRFIHYDENTRAISQYFSRLPAGSKFRISYTSPSKCAEESLKTCHELAQTPIEQIFCYTCLFRKLYLKNCSKWELSPYHKNHINGVFLLGEFGYSEEGNALLNGSCVLSGVAEQTKYLSVDLSKLDALEDIRDEDKKLMDFIVCKQQEISSADNEKVLADMMAHESNHLVNPYQRMNIGVPIGDLRKYEQDRENLRFNKLCLVRAENADALIGYKGQLEYLTYLKSIVRELAQMKTPMGTVSGVQVYSIRADIFLVAANDSVHYKVFHQYILAIQARFEEIQNKQSEITLLARFILVRDHPFLLDRAFAVMEECRGSQLHIITDPLMEAATQVAKNDIKDEMACVRIMLEALSGDGVVPYYQGIYNNRTKRVDKYEALMRIRDAQGNIYVPAQFMDCAKKYRLYLGLNLKMFHATLRDFALLDCGVCINLSVHDILSPNFRKEMREALQQYPNPSNLTFELLEDEYVTNIEGLVEFINEVRSYGVKLAVDDFGSGYSNLLGILKIRPEFIKLDGQIVKNICERVANDAIVEATVLLANRLSIDIVAEFVATAEIQARVVDYGIYYSQGYYFSQPKPIAQVCKELALHADGKAWRPLSASEVRRDGVAQAGGNQEGSSCPILTAMQRITSDSLFRFTLKTSKVQYLGQAQKESGVPVAYQPFPQVLLDKNQIASDDVPVLLHAIDQMRRGITEPFSIRVRCKDGELQWYKVEYEIIFSKTKTPVEVIGKLTNIQREKELAMRLHTDALTSCLRKDSFETLVQEYIQEHPEGYGSLFIIDLDNFKAVNDNLGHQVGDKVLHSAGKKLHEIFRESDLIGRIGGDEFMVFMRDIDHVEVIKKKADELLLALSARYQGGTQSYNVSASIGIARYPVQGSNFQALYGHADMALYDVKKRGKNAYAMYSPVLSKESVEHTPLLLSIG